MPASQTNKPAVHWITDYAAAAAILHSKAFREVTFKGLVPLLGHTIVTLEGPAHYERRALESRLFSLAALQHSETKLIPGIIEQTLQPIAAAGKGCLVEISHAVASRIAAQVLGLDGLNEPSRLQEVSHLLSALVGGTSAKLDATGEVLTRREARNRLRERFINGAIDRRRHLLKQFRVGAIAQDQLPFDLIMLLLQHSDSGGVGPAQAGWEVRHIVAEVAFYAVAAEDTTATLLPRLLHELWLYVEKFPAHRALLLDLNFLRLAAAEALRLYPVVPTIFRQATQAIEISGYKFVEGQTAGLYLPTANRDEEIFGPDAASFQPLRELPPKLRRAGLSFGGGAHLCLGRELALGAPQFGSDSNNLAGEVALVAQALFQHHARPDPAHPVTAPTAYERNVFATYPILLG